MSSGHCSSTRVAIGSGVGKGLLLDALERARRRGFSCLTLDSDPGAVLFDAHHGAVRVGEVPSGSVDGRVLPRIRFDLLAHTSPS